MIKSANKAALEMTLRTQMEKAALVQDNIPAWMRRPIEDRTADAVRAARAARAAAPAAALSLDDIPAWMRRPIADRFAAAARAAAPAPKPAPAPYIPAVLQQFTQPTNLPVQHQTRSQIPTPPPSQYQIPDWYIPAPQPPAVLQQFTPPPAQYRMAAGAQDSAPAPRKHVTLDDLVPRGVERALNRGLEKVVDAYISAKSTRRPAATGETYPNKLPQSSPDKITKDMTGLDYLNQEGLPPAFSPASPQTQSYTRPVVNVFADRQYKLSEMLPNGVVRRLNTGIEKVLDRYPNLADILPEKPTIGR